MGNIAALGNTVVQTTPVGVIEAFAGVNAPAGWLFCDGSAISRVQYPELFSALSTTYGSGDGSTTFNLPDMRGRMPVGKGTHADVTSLGQNEGASLANRRPKHQHTIYDPGHSHTFSAKLNPTRGSYQSAIQGEDGGGGFSNVIYGGVVSNTTGFKVNPEGASSSTSPSDAPPYLVVNYIIKAVADLPRGGWFYQNQPPVVTQLPANPQIGEEVYFYNSTTSGYQHKKYNGTSWTTFDDSGAISITDNSGRVRLPYQPIFSGRVTSGGYKGNVTIVMNAANINRGNHYDTSTGFFTCPIAGAYLCMFQGIFSASPGYGYIYIRKNNSNTDQYAHYNDNTGDWRNPSVNGVVDCNAGDTLSFYVQTVNSNAGLYGSGHNSGTIMYLG